MTSGLPQLRAVQPDGPGDGQPNVMELLSQADGLDRLAGLLRDRILADPATRRKLWEQSLTDTDLFLELAEAARADPKMNLRMLALFGGGVLCNQLMWAAEDAHCWRFDPRAERTTVHRHSQRARYNHESVDVLLEPTIYFRPPGQTINLWEDENVLEEIRGWPQRQLNNDPDDPVNIIEPGDSFVGMADWLELPTDCICPLTATVDTKSTQARRGNFFLTPSCPRIKNGHRGRIFIEPTNGSKSTRIRLKPKMAIGALFLYPVAGRPVPYDSQYYGQGGK